MSQPGPKPLHTIEAIVKNKIREFEYHMDRRIKTYGIPMGVVESELQILDNLKKELSEYLKLKERK